MAGTSNSIITPQGPISGVAKLVAANSNYDAPTTPVAVIATAAIPNGGRITSVRVMPGATCVATDIQLYIKKGGVYSLQKVVNQPIVTLAASNVGAVTPVDFGYSDAAPLTLMAGEELYAAMSIANANGVQVRAEGGFY